MLVSGGIMSQYDSSKFDSPKDYLAFLVKAKDNVNSPAHYNNGKIECITYLEDTLGEGLTYYLEGNIKKYLHRFRYKNGTEDLKKAQWYLNKLIEAEEKK